MTQEVWTENQISFQISNWKYLKQEQQANSFSTGMYNQEISQTEQH